MTPRIGRPPVAWDGLCTNEECRSAGPFYGRDRICKVCRKKNHNAWEKENRERTLEIGRQSAAKRHRRRRVAAIQAYGGRCACCGITEMVFLVIDHVEGRGNIHRRSLTANGSIAGSSNFYAWLEKSKYPPGFQVLCHNCNFAKSNGGCPHGGLEGIAA